MRSSNIVGPPLFMRVKDLTVHHSKPNYHKGNNDSGFSCAVSISGQSIIISIATRPLRRPSVHHDPTPLARHAREKKTYDTQGIKFKRIILTSRVR